MEKMMILWGPSLKQIKRLIIKIVLKLWLKIKIYSKMFNDFSAHLYWYFTISFTFNILSNIRLDYIDNLDPSVYK